MTEREEIDHVRNTAADLGIVDAVSFTCPFCSGQCAAGEVTSGENAGAWAVLHSSPMCSTYERLDPLEFMRAARRKMGIPDIAEA